VATSSFGGQETFKITERIARNNKPLARSTRLSSRSSQSVPLDVEPRFDDEPKRARTASDDARLDSDRIILMLFYFTCD
jgi:hypothetical protein